MDDLQKKIDALLKEITTASTQNTATASCGEQEEIDSSSAQKACLILDEGKLSTAEDCFKYFASLNLLNAYVKKGYADVRIKGDYSFKKGVMQAVYALMEHCPNGVDFGADKQQNIIYLQVYSIQFSFHSCLPKKNNLNLKKVEWQKIQLQPHALKIFNGATNSAINP